MQYQNKKKSTTCPHCWMKVRCPFCKSKELREIIYGFLSIDNKEAFDKKYIAGGCVVEKDSPKFYCKNCGKRFGRIVGDEWWKGIQKKEVISLLTEIEKWEKEKQELEEKVAWLRETEEKLKGIITENKKKLRPEEKKR